MPAITRPHSLALALALALLMLLCTPAWSVHKCPAEGGRVVYQDAPCAGSGITVAEDIEQRKKMAEQARAAAASRKEEAKVSSKTSAELILEAARASCKRGVPAEPAIGMTENEFLHCTQFGLLETPNTINVTETAAGVSKQYVYPSYSGIRYLYTRNSVVTAIQR